MSFKIILISNTEWYLYNFRLSLARLLRDQGWEVILVSPPGSYAARLQEAGFRWLAWDVGRQSVAPWKELAAVVRLAQIYRREQPDLVHHHTIKPVLYGSLAARLARVPCVVHSITGLGYVFLGQDAKARLLRSIVRSLYRLTLGGANSAVIFENAEDRQFFISEGFVSAERTHLIEGVGVDAEHFSPTPQPDSIPLVILPSRMLWDKGVGTLVEAARLLRGRIALRLALVGLPDPGNPASIDEATLRGWQSEGLVEWWGWQDDMRAVYQQAHIVALPSLGEGVPTSLLEAASCARPLVATDVQGCRDVVQHGVNGWLVPPNDPAALAEALYRLASDAPLRQQMGAAGRQLVLEKFTSAQVNQATVQVYRSLLYPSDKGKTQL